MLSADLRDFELFYSKLDTRRKRQLWPPKRCMTPEVINTLTAFNSSRLHYCDELNCGIAVWLLSRLQSVQNAAACLVTGLGRREFANMSHLFCGGYTGCRFVTLLHLLVRALCVRPTLGREYLAALTTATVIVVLPLQVLVCGTVCHCSFDSRMFRLNVYTFIADVSVQVTRIAALWD